MHEPSLSLAAPDAAPTATRGRPRLALTDDQARSLAQQTDALTTKHAGSTGGHRPFVHDFLRAVYHATGETYGAARYRQLLAAYAPQCRPSTSTIELEKINCSTTCGSAPCRPARMAWDRRRFSLPRRPCRHPASRAPTWPYSKSFPCCTR